MKLIAIKDANLNLVEIKSDFPNTKPTPHCKLHGAMNKLTLQGIWRCVTTYYGNPDNHFGFIGNNCKVGCQWCNSWQRRKI